MISISGETLYLDGGLRVRLAGIIFPPGKAGNQTRNTIKELVRTNYLYIHDEVGGPPRGDRNYRAWMYLPDGRSLGLELVTRGVAAVSSAASFRTDGERSAFFTAQRGARTSSLGIWGKR